MRVMVKFEQEILNNMSYAMLENFLNELNTSIQLTEKVKIKYLEGGFIRNAAHAEASIIRMKENIDSVKIVMMVKESDSLESFMFGVEPLSLN